MKKGLASVLLVLGLVVALALLGGAYFFVNKSSTHVASNPVVGQTQASPSPSSIPDATVNLKTYTSNEGKYSIKYPASFQIFVNERFSVDGVKVPIENTTALVSPEQQSANVNYQMTINYKTGSGTNLKNFIDIWSKCADASLFEKAKAYSLGGQQAYIIENAPCSANNLTEIYSIHNGIGYIIEITTMGNYSDISKSTEQLLSTFKFTN